jgi:hypothetical protein
MLEEIRKKQFVAQKTEEARERGKRGTKKERSRQNRNGRKAIHLSIK